MKSDSEECILLEINFLLHFTGLRALDWGGRFPHCVLVTLPTLLDHCGCCEILISLIVLFLLLLGLHGLNTSLTFRCQGSTPRKVE